MHLLGTVVTGAVMCLGFSGRDHKVKAGQRSSEDFGAQGQAQAFREGEGKTQGERCSVHGHIMSETLVGNLRITPCSSVF